VLTLAALASPAPAHAQNAERVEAVEWARAGDLDPAIARLRELRAQYPSDIPIAADLAVILQWAGRDEEMLEVFDAIGTEAAPEYALFAAARSARNVGDYDRAERYLARGAARFPDEPRWAILRALVYASRLISDCYPPAIGGSKVAVTSGAPPEGGVASLQRRVSASSTWRRSWSGLRLR
jgi:tetratricopeptide (TPR) repeat protein